MKILIAEDDDNMCKILKLYLQKEGYEVECVSDGEDVLNYFEHKKADLLLLDWMMPKKDGIETCKELRLMKIPVKIIMLTAKTTADNEYQGLSIGSDDYIRKPFDIKVLLLRIKKLCHVEKMLRFKDISMNQDTHEVYIGDRLIDLTRKEFELLLYFLMNQNLVLSREKILDSVWGIDYDGDVRTVDTHIRRLRKKIGDSYIQTIFGKGYIMGGIHE